LSDEFPVLRRHREWFVGILFFFYFLIGIPSCTDAGVYFVELLQNYAGKKNQSRFFFIKYLRNILAFYSIIIAVFFEAIAVSWLYGIERISEDVKQMLGTKPGRFWIGTWCIAAPVFLGVNIKILIFRKLWNLFISRVLFFPV
jgi:solute carrier family 6 dopamine transporter-like protein 3